MEPEEFFEKYITEIAKEKFILDVGGATPFQKHLRKYSALFKDNFKTLDIDPAKKPDIVGDAHNLPFRNGEVDAILCWSVLEHVENPFKAVSEMHRVLRKGGKALVHVPFIYPFHGVNDCPDYFRFTQQGVELLFKDFSKLDYCRRRGYFDTFTPFMPVWIGKVYSIFAVLLDKIGFGRSTTSGFDIFVIK